MPKINSLKIMGDSCYIYNTKLNLIWLQNALNSPVIWRVLFYVSVERAVLMILKNKNTKFKLEVLGIKLP
jgi:hypothetical protein